MIINKCKHIIFAINVVGSIALLNDVVFMILTSAMFHVSDNLSTRLSMHRFNFDKDCLYYLSGGEKKQ